MADEPLLRLIETKNDIKDAARKARHEPLSYGMVPFLTPDQSRLRIVNEAGVPADYVDLDSLSTVLANPVNISLSD